MLVVAVVAVVVVVRGRGVYVCGGGVGWGWGSMQSTHIIHANMCTAYCHDSSRVLVPFGQ